MKTKRILFLPLLLLGGLMMGQKPVTTAVTFLFIAPDAHGAGLAGCGVASDADVFSMNYNPAKYAFIEKGTSVGGGYSRWMMGETNLFHASAAQRIGKWSTLAASFRYQNGMTVDYYDPNGFSVGSFAPHDFAVDLAYAIQLNDALSVALAGRYIQSSAFDPDGLGFHDFVKNGHSIAIDLGIYYHKPVNLGAFNGQYAFGASITNLGNKINYGKAGNQQPVKTSIPTTLRLGASLKTNFNNDHTLTGMMDFTKLLVPSEITIEGNDESVFMGMLQSFYDAPGGFMEELSEINYGVGLEYAWKKMVFVRMGYFNQPCLKGNRKYLSCGLGLEFSYFGIDAAYNLSTTSLHNADRFLVGAHFNI